MGYYRIPLYNWPFSYYPLKMFPNIFCVIAFMFFNFDIDNIRVNSNNIKFSN